MDPYYTTLDFDITAPETWPLSEQAALLAKGAETVYEVGLLALRCLDLLPTLRADLRPLYQSLSQHLEDGSICSRDFRDCLRVFVNELRYRGAFEHGLPGLDSLASRVAQSLIHSEMFARFFGEDRTIRYLTPDRIEQMLRLIDTDADAPRN